MDNAKKLNSVPSQIELIEDSFISPIPSEFIWYILELIQLTEYKMINMINIENKLFMIKFMTLIFSFNKPIDNKYKIPDKANILNLVSLINIVFISSFDIQNKMYESTKVNNIYMQITDYMFSLMLLIRCQLYNLLV